MTELRIVLPAISSDKVSTDLRHLTRAIAEVTGEELGGGLGGSDGYGFDHETSVFAMFPFWWGECDCGVMTRINARWYDSDLDEHPVDCECPADLEYQAWVKEQGKCLPTCSLERPNFLYKPTGAEVRFYKYIGRDMEIDGDLPTDFLNHCLESLGEAA